MNPPDPSDEKRTAWRKAGRMVLVVVTAVFFIPLLFWLQLPYPISPHGDWRDRLGSFWLVGCAFGVLVS